jgi:cell division protein YceG involved in septum cleavage
MNPDTADRYLYFLAKGDGTNGHVFAHTYEEHLQNVAQYMGGGSPEPVPETSAAPTPDP